MAYGLSAGARALRLLAVLAFGALLAGCVIQSKAQLIAPDEGVAALPLTIWLTSYKEAEGGVAKGEDPPMELRFKDTLYTSGDNSFQVRFVALDRPDTYLAEIIEPAEGHVYGIARYRNDVLVLNALLAVPDLKAMLATEQAGAGAEALRDVTVSDSGALVLTERKALTYLIRMNLEGRLAMSPFVLYVSEFADAPAPPTLVPDGDFWKVPTP